MIRHIVFFSLKDAADAPRAVEGLSRLARIPHARRLEIARNRRDDPLSQEIDIVVYGEFDDLDALAAYKAHPLYQDSIRLVRPLRELRYAVNFDTRDAVGGVPAEEGEASGPVRTGSEAARSEP